MTHLSTRLRRLLCASFLSISAATQAAWQISDSSTVGYLSLKNNAIAEYNYFSGVSGALSEEGELTLSIALDTVETQVAIRNQRMRDLFFKVVDYPEATISASLSPDDIASLGSDGVIDRTIPVTLQLHGQSAELSATVRAQVSNGHLYVTTLQPLLLSVADFGLEAGVATLQEIAGLQAIARVIPVTVDLHFVPQ